MKLGFSNPSAGPRPSLKTNLLRWMSNVAGGKNAVAALEKVYRERPDLQEAFPEAKNGDMRRLTNWAAGVARNAWPDSSHRSLRPYFIWYFANRSKLDAIEAVNPWPAAVATSSISNNPLPTTLNAMQDRGARDISSHLVTLSLIVQEFRLQRIVELGTRDGNSTLTFLEAVKHTGGRVTSIDVEPCLVARKRVEHAGLNERWTFIQGDDLSLQPPRIPDSIDFLFIDTNHLHEHTLAELEAYSRYLLPRAWVALHDSVSFPGVASAVLDFVAKYDGKFSFYPYVHQNGLILLRLTGGGK